jgi:uncharacterized membrane protein YbhN (UPF0104 family)
MEGAPLKKTESPLRRFIKLLVKVAVTVVCFWYISKKIDFSQAVDALEKANWWFLLVALCFFIFSKLFSAVRLNIYFRNINIHLSEWSNIKLYWLGMFYNLFLPGAISGDAYKVILLTRRFGVAYKKTTAAVLLDRFSGLLALGLILSVYGFIVLDNRTYQMALLTGAAIAVIALYYAVLFYFKDFIPGFWPTFFWGLLVQLLQVICVYLIVAALQLPVKEHEWIFIFLAAAVISVLPISLGGGLGTREVVFVEGARYFHLDQHIAIVVSLLFYLITVLGSAEGLYFVFRTPFSREE